MDPKEVDELFKAEVRANGDDLGFEVGPIEDLGVGCPACDGRGIDPDTENWDVPRICAGCEGSGDAS